MSAARAERPAKKERNVRIRSLFPWVLLLASCAATEEQAAVPVPVVAPAPVAACLTFVIQDERPAAEDEYQRRIRADVRDAFEQELTRAGFTVVYNESYPHDVVARLSTAPGSAVSEGSQVESVLALEGDSGRFAELRARTAQSSRTYAYEVARGLVDRVFQAPEVASFARELRRPNVERVEARLVAEHQAAVSRALESDPAPSPTPVAPVATTTPAPATPPAELPFLVGPKDPSAYAIVIGIDTYADGRVVPGARKDAERFVRMARDTLGVPEKQISLAVGERARRADMDALVSWMKLGAPMGSRVYVYFAGLATSRQSGPMFLLPYDGDAETMEKSGVRLSKLLFSLSDTKAREVITFIDAGSAGVGARSVAPKGGDDPGACAGRRGAAAGGAVPRREPRRRDAHDGGRGLGALLALPLRGARSRQRGPRRRRTGHLRRAHRLGETAGRAGREEGERHAGPVVRRWPRGDPRLALGAREGAADVVRHGVAAGRVSPSTTRAHPPRAARARTTRGRPLRAERARSDPRPRSAGCRRGA
jgi:hypothetical protein